MLNWFFQINKKSVDEFDKNEYSLKSAQPGKKVKRERNDVWFALVQL